MPDVKSALKKIKTGYIVHPHFNGGCLSKAQWWVSFPFIFVLFCVIKNSPFQRPWSCRSPGHLCLSYSTSITWTIPPPTHFALATLALKQRLLFPLPGRVTPTPPTSIPQASACPLPDLSPWTTSSLGLCHCPCAFLINHTAQFVSYIFISLLPKLSNAQVPCGQELDLFCHL